MSLLYNSHSERGAEVTTAVDLFAGCGGLTQGFQDAGYDITGAFEYWDVAADCYEANFEHPVFRIDLSDVDAAVQNIRQLDPDIIIGGPPCQDFSHAGKRVEDKRASLTKSFALIISAIKPKAFVMENVDRARKSYTYKDVRETLKAAGYGLTEKVLTASFCGVPQRRRRFFCIGILGGEDGVLETILNERMTEKETTVRDYFGDTLGTEYYYRHPRNYHRRAVFSIDEPAPTMRGVNRPIPKGYPGHPNDAHVIDDSVRPLSTLERSLIQTFPANFKWVGSKTDCEQMIGNAVPVKLAEFVATALRDHIEKKPCSLNDIDKESFISWLRTYKKYQSRTVSSTLSNLRRAERLVPFNEAETLSIYIALLNEAEGFSGLGASVKSHLKSAVKLYFEYSTK